MNDEKRVAESDQNRIIAADSGRRRLSPIRRLFACRASIGDDRSRRRKRLSIMARRGAPPRQFRLRAARQRQIPGAAAAGGGRRRCNRPTNATRSPRRAANDAERAAPFMAARVGNVAERANKNARIGTGNDQLWRWRPSDAALVGNCRT